MSGRQKKSRNSSLKELDIFFVREKMSDFVCQMDFLSGFVSEGNQHFLCQTAILSEFVCQTVLQIFSIRLADRFGIRLADSITIRLADRIPRTLANITYIHRLA